MSTRATYEFRTPWWDDRATTTTLYIHSDGYPTGAASYFKAALGFKPSAPNSNFVDCFFRANAMAEITGSHSAHGDTEYRYTVTQIGEWRTRTDPSYASLRGSERSTLRVVAQAGWEDRWETFFDGPVEEFVKQAKALEARDA